MSYNLLESIQCDACKGQHDVLVECNPLTSIYYTFQCPTADMKVQFRVNPSIGKRYVEHLPENAILATRLDENPS